MVHTVIASDPIKLNSIQYHFLFSFAIHKRREHWRPHDYCQKPINTVEGAQQQADPNVL
jgi:hypothetical protein